MSTGCWYIFLPTFLFVHHVSYFYTWSLSLEYLQNTTILTLSWTILHLLSSNHCREIMSKHAACLQTRNSIWVMHFLWLLVQHTWSYYTKKNIILNTKLLGIKKYTYTFSPSTQEAEPAWSGSDQLGHTKKSCLKIQINNNSNNNNNELSTEL